MKKEWKSISIDKEVYILLKNKQQELIDKKDGNYVELGYVAGAAILLGIDKVIE